MKKIKVAFCLRDMQLGGVESVLTRTLDELSKNQNIELSVITYVDIKTEIYKKYFQSHSEIKRYSLYPCAWLETKLPHFFLARIFVHVMRDIYRNIKRFFGVMNKFEDIDVFIDYHDFGFADELKKIKEVKKIAWFHSSVNVFVKRNFINKVQFYDNVVVLTDACMQELVSLYPQCKNKILRIYNPIDVEKIKNQANDKIDINGKYFCCVSRLSGDKDIITLLDGFDKFWNVNKKPSVKLVVVGDGDKAEYYRNYAGTLSAAKQIVFVGAKTNPYPYVKNAIAHVLSSQGEGFGAVLVESMAVSTLNIASDCKYGPREILLDGNGGMLFMPGDNAQLSKCLTQVFYNKIDTKKMLLESTKSLKRFDIKTVIKQIINLIS